MSIDAEIFETRPRAARCPWCALIRSGKYVQAEEAAYVVLGPDAPRSGGGIILVPRDHVPVLTDLPAPTMARLLAGLSGLCRAGRGDGRRNIEVKAHPTGAGATGGHLHFHLKPQGGGGVVGPEAVAESAFASLAQTLSN